MKITKKVILVLIVLFQFTLLAQLTANEFHIVEQEDSIYYLLTDNTLFKFYSTEESGTFYLTKYIEGNYGSDLSMILNDNYLFLYNSDSIFYYLNNDPLDISFENIFVPGYTITSMHGFGPYFFIRSGNTYKLLKVENGVVTTVEDSLFSHPSQLLVFFTYPFVVIAGDIYKYIEEFDFYLVWQIPMGNVNNGITGNKITSFTWSPIYPYQSYLNTNFIEEPNFPSTHIYNWGSNIPEIRVSGTLIPRKNIYYFLPSKLVITKDAVITYSGSAEDRIVISDYYIFLLNGNELKFSKWNSGSVFYPFTWIDVTSVHSEDKVQKNFLLSQNYPNPFNPTTKIKYTIPNVTLSGVEGSLVTLKVYDVLGREVATLVNEEKHPGVYEVEFNTSELSSGIYFYKLQAENYSSTKKMIYLK
jgi:hypothetical protein